VHQGKYKLKCGDGNSVFGSLEIGDRATNPEQYLAPEIYHTNGGNPHGVVESLVIIISNTIPHPMTVMIHAKHTFP
jgi:hypothetical protein